jgi:hypothetical protein
MSEQSLKNILLTGSPGCGKTAAPPLACTLLACWEEGHEEPWLVLIDRPLGAASPCW